MDTNSNQVGFDYIKKVRPRNNLRQLCGMMRGKAKRARFVRFRPGQYAVSRRMSGGLYRRLIYVLRSPGPQNQGTYPEGKPCQYALKRFDPTD